MNVKPKHSEQQAKHRPEGKLDLQYDQKFLSLLNVEISDGISPLISRAVIGGMAGAYLDDSFSLYYMGDSLLQCLGYTYEEIAAATGLNFLNTIHPDDRAAYQSSLRAALEKGDEYEIVCRVLCKDGSCRWMRDVGQRVMTNEGKPSVILLRMDVGDMLESQRKLTQKAAELEAMNRRLVALTANIPGGVCEVALDNGFTLLYGNDGFFSLYGYTQEQITRERNDHLLDIIFVDDRNHVKDTIETAWREKKQGFGFEHRIVRRNGTIVWVLVRGNFTSKSEHPAANCVVIDITERKRIEQELRINEERFRIALQQTDNSIFDYDFITKFMIHADKSAEQYGLQKITANVPDSLVESGIVHPDSAEAFLGMYQEMREGARAASCKILARLAAGEYVWRKVSMTAIRDENGTTVRAIGVLEDIDEQVRREQSLRDRSERDALTKLLNRGATESRTREILLRQPDGEPGALFVIDIDRFKSINDQYGHPFGDFVLVESTRRISALFHEKDVIGRIGGDEFIVYINGISAYSVAEMRAETICRAFQEPFQNNGSEVRASCSIGIAFCPAHGSAFQELYQRADIALYEAKRNGKSRYVVFRPDMLTGAEWMPYSNTAIDTKNR